MDKYKCEKCLKTFSTEKRLTNHNNKYHCLKIEIPNYKISPENDIPPLNNQILKFNDNSIIYFNYNGELYFKAKDIAIVLGYEDTSQTIRKNVDLNDKITVSSLKKKILSNCCTSTKKLFENEQPQTIYINENGLKALILKSHKSNSLELAKQLNINIETKYLRKELEIVTFFEKYLKKLNIVYILQKSVANYKIDLYLPNNNIAVEIDEYGHSDQ
jgi:hypothetical protein